MLWRTLSAGSQGLDGFLITVEAAIGEGAPTLRVVGHSDGPLVAAAERARAAIDSCALALPACAQFIHVAPSSHRKHGRGIDLAIACALLVAHDVLPASSLDGVLAWGELASDGGVLPAPGTLLAADTARRHGFRVLALACASEAEAAPVPDLDLLLVPHLAALIAHLRGDVPLPCGPSRPALVAARNSALLDDRQQPDPIEAPTDWSLALELMLAGGHHLLVTSTDLCVNEHELARLLPALTREEAIELTKIHDLLTPTRLLRTPRVRRTSGHASAGELFGSVQPILRPGEVSLADRGVLVLDELHAVASHELFRYVLEDHSISHDGARFPARFRLLASTKSITRLPAALRERFDLVIRDGQLALSSGAGSRIEVARARQCRRLAPTPWSCNAEIPRIGEALQRLCPCAEGLARDPRVVRVARTLADLDLSRDGSEPLDADMLDVAERLVMEGR